jgi:cytochrome b
VLFFVGLAFSGLTEQGPHVYVGLSLFTILIWRVLWGIVGSETSRFSQFICSPARVISYLKGGQEQHLGHNPAGGYMVITLISTLTLQCITGLALSGMLDPLPGSEFWLSDDIFDVCVLVHENLINGLFVLVSLHLLAILAYKLKGKPLVKAMITGEISETGRSADMASFTRALVVLLIALTITATIYMLSIE